MNKKDSPVPVSGLLETVAVINPKPTELKAKIAVNGTAIRIPAKLLSGLNPNKDAKVITTITCIIAITMLDII